MSNEGFVPFLVVCLLYGGCVTLKNTAGREARVEFGDQATVFTINRPLSALTFSTARERFTYVVGHDSRAHVQYYRSEGVFGDDESFSLSDDLAGSCDGRVDSIERVIGEKTTTVKDDETGTVFQKQPLLAFEAQNVYQDALRRLTPKIEKEFKQYGVKVNCGPVDKP